MKIEIECEWDEGDLIVWKLMVDGKEPTQLLTKYKVYASAQNLLNCVAKWQKDENKRNISP